MKITADCYIENNGNVLLVKAGYRDYWQFPGGHAEMGETPYQAAVREVYEEVGEGIRVTHLLVCNVELDAQGRADNFCFLFAGDYDEKTPISLQTDELAEFAWVAFADVSEKLHPLLLPLFAYAEEARKKATVIYLEGGRII